MATMTEPRLIGTTFRCDECSAWGVKSWAQSHAAQTGHTVFTVQPDR